MNKDNCIRLFADHQQIKECKEKISLEKISLNQIAKVLALSGNEVRLKILYLLTQEKELCPCDIADILEMSVPAISQHLRKLKDGNIVKTRKVGQTIHYSLQKENLNILLPIIESINSKTPTA
jgi:DNA-binding transcriptional ArsR family regulator